MSVAQFVPGWIFTADVDSIICDKPGEGDEFVLELDFEGQTSTVFAAMPPESCPGLRSITMSPDGKHLRVAAANWGAILEFDSQGNWQVVIDGSDGVFPAAYYSSITYDREGNFYVSNYYTLNAKVIKFPADGGAPQVLAYYDNSGVILQSPYGISVGRSGEVYVADRWRLIRIAEDGVVTLFDELPNFIWSVLVDDFGYLNVQMGSYWYRYALGDPSSGELFADCDGSPFVQDICGSYTLALSPDRSGIYTTMLSNYDIISVNPADGSIEAAGSGFVNPHGMAVVPLRNDVDGDGDSDLIDLEWLTACMEGPQAAGAPACGMGDMDADGDVDLFDVRFFFIGHSALAN